MFDMAVSPGAGRGCQGRGLGCRHPPGGPECSMGMWGCTEHPVDSALPQHLPPAPPAQRAPQSCTCHQLPKPCSISPCSGCVALHVLSLWLPAKLWGGPFSSLHSHVIKSSGELVVVFGSCPFPQPCHIKGFLEPAAQDPNL